MTSRSMVRFSVLSIVTVLLGATLAQAAVIGVSTLVKDPGAGNAFASPDAALGAPWVAYTLGLQGTAGELIGGVDVSIKGQLHQRWTFDEDAGEFVATGNSANITNGDSHLRAVAGAIFGSGPTEDNPGTGSPLADTATADYGVGTTLSGAWGITNALSTANLAYIVIPKGSEPTLDIRVQVANPGGEIIGDLDAAAFGFVPDVDPVVGDLNLVQTVIGEVVAGTVAVSDVASLGFVGNPLEPTFTPLLPGKPRIVNNAPTIGLDGSFSWDTSGALRGTYVWNLLGENGSASDPGTVTVEVTAVPEPATLCLIGLALAGFAGFRRK